jgi:hypothetical protein
MVALEVGVALMLVGHMLLQLAKLEQVEQEELLILALKAQQHFMEQLQQAVVAVVESLVHF